MQNIMDIFKHPWLKDVYDLEKLVNMEYESNYTLEQDELNDEYAFFDKK